MVAVIKTGHSVHRILNYNENKVKEGVAECISALNYPINVENLSLNHKLNRLLKQAALNENVTRNSVHISLNFDPSETISKERLQKIAERYMDKIGFGDQPYLVYQHHDAGHPHLHIVTIKVRADGSRIDTNNIGRNQSETARKEIEESFGLVRAEDSKQRKLFELKPANAQRVLYGRTETKRAISSVLNTVLSNYKYTSLPELNAVLGLYNVTADRGSEDSRVFKTGGLFYRIVDEKGSKVGVPIKASNFFSKPTLAYLDERFIVNETGREKYKGRVKNAVDLTLLKHKELSVQHLIKALEKEGIHTVLRQNAGAVIYGITYVDHRTKCVFNGSALGKQYSAKAILARCGQSQLAGQKASFSETENQTASSPISNSIGQSDDAKVSLKSNSMKQQAMPKEESAPPGNTSILEGLVQPENTFDYVPNQFKKQGKKKRKKNNNHL